VLQDLKYFLNGLIIKWEFKCAFWSRGMFTIYLCSAPYWNRQEM